MSDANIELNCAPLIKREVAKLTVNVKVSGFRRWTWRLRIMQALLALAARIGGIGIKVDQHIGIEVS